MVVSVVPDVTDVLVSPSSVVTEFVIVLVLYGLGICGTAVLFLSPRSVLTLVELRRKR